MHAHTVRSRRRAAVLWAAGLAAAVPWMLVARAVDRYGVNVPFWDQWMMTPLILAAARGEWAPDLILAQHNEHRLVVPQLAWYVLGRLTRWNVRAELAASVAVATATLVVLARLVVVTTRGRRTLVTVWGLLVAGVLTFSLAQWENWAWGFQLQVFLNALGGALTFWALARWNGGWMGLVAAIGACFLAAFSFANGLVLLAGLPVAVLAAAITVRGAPRLLPVLVAAAAAAAGVTAYFTGWVHPGHHPPLGQVWQQPVDALRYVLAYLGAGFSPRDATGAVRWGGAGVALFVTIGAALWWGSRASRRMILPWLSFGGYVLLTAAVTAVGRVGFGIEQALSPRYVTLTVPFWLAVAVLAGCVCDELWDRPGRRGLALGMVAVLVAGVYLAGRGYRVAWREAEGRLAERRDMYQAAVECLRFEEVAPDGCLTPLYPAADAIRGWARALRAVGYSVYAEPPEPALASYEVTAGLGGYLDHVIAVDGRQVDTLWISGWAMDPTTQAPPVAVLVTVDDAVVGRAACGRKRPDVQRTYGRAMRRSGWVFRLGRFRLAAGTHRLQAWSLRRDGRLSALERSRMFTVGADHAVVVAR